VTPLFSQSTEVVDPLYRSYGVGQTGHISKLGVEISITPEISVKSGITGFLVQVTYKDPLIRSGEVVSLLHPTTFAASCEPRRRSQEHGPYERTNDRGTHFVVLLHQGCKDTKLGIPIPYLEASILCSDLARELRYIDAVASNKIFDISPTGFRQQVKTDIHDLVAVGRQAYDTYSVVSNVILVFSLISIAGEAITVEAFVLEALEGPGKEYLQGLVEGSLVEGAFDYVDSKYGLRVEFKLTGWEVVCRICHRKFHVESLKDGDLLRCPNGDAEARVFFH
jgi:hypothetical protein